MVHIKGDLLAGRLQPGDRLPSVAELSDQLGLGQASVREAYRVLESLGIVEVVQGRGTTVAASFRKDSDSGPINYFSMAEQQSINYLFEARKLIEPELSALAAKRARSAEVDAIFEAAAEMENLYSQGDDFIEPDIRFHELVAVAAHNPVMLKMLSALNNLLLDSRRLTSRIPGASEKAIHFHKLIAAAIRDQNGDGARALMYQHLDDVERDTLRFERESAASAP